MWRGSGPVIEPFRLPGWSGAFVVGGTGSDRMVASSGFRLVERSVSGSDRGLEAVGAGFDGCYSVADGRQGKVEGGLHGAQGPADQAADKFSCVWGCARQQEDEFLTAVAADEIC